MQSTFRKIRPSRAPSNDNSSSPSNVHLSQAKQIKIDARHNIRSIAFLDGKHVVSAASDKQKIRCWRAEDGKEAVGTSMDAGSTVCSIAVSRDGKLIVSGMIGGEVMVWNAESHKKVTEFSAHSKQVFAVDVSSDATKVVTGSEDKTACVWSLSTGRQLLGPLKHDHTVVATKFSPNGCFVATATWDRYSIRIYNNQNGQGPIVEGLIRVNSASNQSLAWASDSKLLFALSSDGIINCLDVSTGNAVVQWPIHGGNYPTCIALASNGTFIAASDGSSVSFWDTTTHKQIGQVIQDDRFVQSMTISPNGLATGGHKTIMLHSLSDILPSSYLGDVSASNQSPREQGTEQTSKDIDREDRDERITDPEGATRKPRLELKIPQRAANHELNSLNETIKSLRTQNKNLNDGNAHLKETLQNLRADFADSQHKVDTLGELLHAHEWKHQCEVLYNEGPIIEAAKYFLATANTMSEGVRTNKLFVDWLPEFTRRCISMLEKNGDEASSANKHHDALAAYSTALLLSPLTPKSLLTKWASTMLTRNPTNEALSAAAKFNLPRFLIYRVICDVLQRGGRISEAIECFQMLQRGDLMDSSHATTNVKEMTSVDETEWVANFKLRCLRKLEQRGDLAMTSASYEDAIVDYTTALTLDPISIDLLTKRSKARARIGSWEDSLEDADAAIKVNPSSPRGYERKHVALLGARRYDEAIDAYNDMLQKIEQSPDPDTRESRKRYASPSQTMEKIRECVKQVQQNTPLVLINTKTGRLCDKHQCLGEFEADPKFKELVSSMTTRLDDSRIMQTVQEHFRYATFSHTWEDAKSLFHDVLHDSVHTLAESPTVLKLAMFCTTVREAGLRWAWCDTCCINAADGSVVQESLTSMFRWYHQSFLTIVHLKGVRSDSELVTLERSFWNTRAWTLQEFFASKVIRFYTEDWKPYLPQEGVYNHKDSSAIMREMAAANGVDEQVLLSLRPGSDNVRQKLCLAATRAATKEEDKAYSLFGIFDVSIPVTYGEKQQYALGRLLQEVLTRSGDVTLLAWTGKASDYHSCLPADIYVYRMPTSPHVPRPIEDGKMEILVAELRTSSQFTDSAVKLYDRVVALSSPRLVSRRLSLSCMMFPLKGPLVQSSDCGYIYRAVTSALGNVDIETTEDLSGLNNLVLVHPWLQCLLEPALPIQDLNVDDPSDRLSSLDGDDRDDEPDTRFTDTLSPPSSHTVSPSQLSSQPDKLTKALRLFARLREPFGALLLVPTSHKEYKRVASDHPIVVQLHKDVAPRYLLQKIRTPDVL